MKTIVLAVAVLAAVAAAGFAWQRHQALGESQVALAGANGQLRKAQADLKALKAEFEPLRKETAELKAMVEQQKSEVVSAKAFLEAERASTMRVREELTTAREQMAFILRSRAAQSSQTFPGPVMIQRGPPPAVRAAPSTGTTQGSAVRAQ